MKNIIYHIVLVCAIFLGNSVCAHNSGLDFKKNQAKSCVDYSHSNTENLCFDVCFEDLLEDDSNESQKEKSSSDKISNCNASLTLNFFSSHTYNKVLPAQFYLLRKTSLFIFICVLRL